MRIYIYLEKFSRLWQANMLLLAKCSLLCNHNTWATGLEKLLPPALGREGVVVLHPPGRSRKFFKTFLNKNILKLKKLIGRSLGLVFVNQSNFN